MAILQLPASLRVDLWIQGHDLWSTAAEGHEALSAHRQLAVG